MLYTYVLKGQCRRGKGGQQHMRTGQTYPTPAWAAWRDDIVFQLRRIHGHKPPIADLCKLYLVFTHGDKRQRNIAGMMDALMHCLERARVITCDENIVAADIQTNLPPCKALAGVLLKVETL